MLNKDVRAKLAKETINVVIPHILKNNPRAQNSVRSSELIRFKFSPSTQAHTKSGNRASKASLSLPTTVVQSLPEVDEHLGDAELATISLSPATDNISEAIQESEAMETSAPSPLQTTASIEHNPEDIRHSGVTRSSTTLPTRPILKVRIVQSDTYDAVRSLLNSSPADRGSSRIAAFNMCSIYNPGGGVLRGTLAQEESLCLRSTLYPSLSYSYYRLPELSAIYSPDVLVFRSSDLTDLPKSKWFFTDIISIAALKQPETKRNDEGRLVYAEDYKDI